VSLVEKLRYTGIETIGYVPWGSHFSQLYNTKHDLIDVLVPYFQAGLLNNEACMCITLDDAGERVMKEALSKVMLDFDNYIKMGQMKFMSYKDIYLENNKVKVNKLIDTWINLYDNALSEGYEGLRISGDESWVETSQWSEFIKYEKELDSIISKYKVIALCTYSLSNCRASDVIDIIQSHQSMLVRRDLEWVLLESSTTKETKEELRNAKRLYAVLSKINHAIIRIKDTNLLFEEACRIVVEDGLCSVAWIGTVDKQTKEIKTAIQWGFEEAETREIERNFRALPIKSYKFIYDTIMSGKYSVCNYVLETSKGFFWHDVYLKHNIKSFASFPLIKDGEAFAVMNLYSKEYSFINDEDVELLNQLCADIAFAVETLEKEKLRKRMEEELRQSEERYRMIFELSPEAIFVYSNLEIGYVNPAGLRLLGAKTAEELIGKKLLDFIHKDYHNLVLTRKEALRRGHGALPFVEEKFVKLDGTVIEVEAAASNYPEKDKHAMVSVVRDITERKKLEQMRKTSEENMRLLNEAREYDKLRTEFFANISHELRTPINVILSAIQLLNIYMSKDDFEQNHDKLVKYIFTMQQNCYRLLRLVSNIIDITKIDAGFFELQLANQDIVSIVEDITLSVSEYIEHKGITLVFDTEIEEKRIACDADKIERVMLNLLSNSIKFTKEGGKISVNIFYNEDKITISVKDDGIGIPKEELGYVFERFQQVDKSLRRSHEGSGIGLSIVKSLVELHEGTIRVESEYGKGTEFIVELPIKLIEPSKEINYIQLPEDNIEKINIEFSDIYS
jgi:PAS domain S-box-containing protein